VHPDDLRVPDADNMHLVAESEPAAQEIPRLLHAEMLPNVPFLPMLRSHVELLHVRRGPQGNLRTNSPAFSSMQVAVLTFDAVVRTHQNQQNLHHHDCLPDVNDVKLLELLSAACGKPVKIVVDGDSEQDKEDKELREVALEMKESKRALEAETQIMSKALHLADQLIVEPMLDTIDLPNEYRKICIVRANHGSL